jgi:hypothetical protein
MEMEEQVEGDAEQVNSEPEQLDDYLGGPRDLSVLTMYHVHVAKTMYDGVVRLYNFSLM